METSSSSQPSERSYNMQDRSYYLACTTQPVKCNSRFIPVEILMRLYHEERQTTAEIIQRLKLNAPVDQRNQNLVSLLMKRAGDVSWYLFCLQKAISRRKIELFEITEMPDVHFPNVPPNLTEHIMSNKCTDKSHLEGPVWYPQVDRSRFILV